MGSNFNVSKKRHKKEIKTKTNLPLNVALVSIPSMALLIAIIAA
jgi:hypothetical protein